MRNSIPVLVMLFLAACSQVPENGSNASTEEEAGVAAGWFGEEFEITEAIAATEVAGLMNDSSENVFVVEGMIEECCQKKGCWMKIGLGDGESMRVSFKDYGFFVPLDAAGRSMTMKGIAQYDTLDVGFLKHLAEDANRPQEEIDAITEPELALIFEATGVFIK